MKCTASGQPPANSEESSVPTSEKLEDGQFKDHWVLCEMERSMGYVRPVRTKYIHEKCGSITTMGRVIAETYARDPSFYGSTFCCNCHGYFPVGEHGEFIWDDDSKEKVGT